MQKSLIFLSLMSLSVFCFADGHSKPSTDALDVYTCSFNKGKDVKDMLKVAREWDDWADDNHTLPLSSWIMTPQAVHGPDFPWDMMWLNVTKNHHSAGVLYDEWTADGGKLGKKFDDVCAPVSHFYFTSFEVRPFSEEDTPGYLAVWACTFNGGKGFQDLPQADATWNEHLNKVGMPGGIYRWVPGIGYPRASTEDFLNVFVTESMADHGKASDIMLAGSGQVLNQTYGDIAQCDRPRVWAAQSVGGKE